jgi:hypothetical protein
MITCPRCGRENDDENQFCARCGLEFATVDMTPKAAEEALHCYRHPKRVTLLRCGKCERPICERCVVLSPAGTRCQECSKSQIPFRPEAVVHEAKVGVRNILRLGPWGIWAIIAILGFAFSLMRGCMNRPEPEPIYEEEPGYSQPQPGPSESTSTSAQ